MYLSSIEIITQDHIIRTMNEPIRVYASDMENYICKYNKRSQVAYRLYKEYLIGSYLALWDFYTTPIQIIQVLDKHLDARLGIDRRFFSQPCFGTRVIESANEIDKHNAGAVLFSKNKKELKSHLLKLSFFDIWTCNEDRSHNNYNILYIVENGRYKLFPIDHEACFNHRELREPLVPITLEDSLIYSELFHLVFKKTELNSPMKINPLKDFYYLYTLECRKLTPTILNSLPSEWGIDTSQEQDLLNRFFLSDEWFEESWYNFVGLISLF